MWLLRCLALVVLLGPRIAAGADHHWTSALGQGTEEATILSEDGSRFSIFCSAGGNGEAGILFTPHDTKLQGKHSIQVSVDDKSLTFELTASALRTTGGVASNVIANLANMLVPSRAADFKVKVPDMKRFWTFSLQNVRDALTYDDNGAVKLILDPCLR
jgi:hypothetical protein